MSDESEINKLRDYVERFRRIHPYTSGTPLDGFGGLPAIIESVDATHAIVRIKAPSKDEVFTYPIAELHRREAVHLASFSDRILEVLAKDAESSANGVQAQAQPAAPVAVGSVKQPWDRGAAQRRAQQEIEERWSPRGVVVPPKPEAPAPQPPSGIVDLDVPVAKPTPGDSADSIDARAGRFVEGWLRGVNGQPPLSSDPFHGRGYFHGMTERRKAEETARLIARGAL